MGTYSYLKQNVCNDSENLHYCFISVFPLYISSINIETRFQQYDELKRFRKGATEYYIL